ncbi:hypothetical protein [Aquimarina megaterium]|uniref:hypothetical protein n=1 Tax=Aquimarina megaterium TaxID=1443666 RepID=UPI0005517C67|nr:hypothetical protein [Aquimarina megaterium]
MYHILTKAIVIFALLFFSTSYAQKKEANTPLYSSDTLRVGYTYWWPQSGPFIGNCGDTYALVFLGTIQHIDDPIKNDDMLYTSQRGIIDIDEVLTSRILKKNRYDKQKFFVSDYFYEQDVKEGDRVLVFCYEYEDNYSIPGGKSMLKIKGDNDPILLSIKRYIQSNQNALELKKDVALWKNYGLEAEVKQVIACKETMD